MLVHETRQVRRFVLRLEPGEDVTASLQRFAKADLYRAGWVRGRGVLEWAELASFDVELRAFRPARRIEGPLNLTFEGALAMRLGEPAFEVDAVVSRERDGIPHALGGRLTQGAALSVECVIEIFEDARLERQEDLTLVLLVWRGGGRVPGVAARARAVAVEPKGAPPEKAAVEKPIEVSEKPIEKPMEKTAPLPEVKKPVVPSGPISWAAVAAVSESAPRARDEEESREPQKGDFVEHRQFGLCRVEGEDPDGGTRVRLPSGARKVLRLDVMEVLPPRREADRTIFPVRPRSR